MTSGRCFREAVCAKLGCAPEAYAQTVFWHCLYSHARLPAKVLARLRPNFFEDDLDLIRVVDDAETRAAFRREMDLHRYHHPLQGFLREVLRIRVSGKKLTHLATQVLPRGSGDKGFAQPSDHTAAP
jgi:hypothetical protein